MTGDQEPPQPQEPRGNGGLLDAYFPPRDRHEPGPSATSDGGSKQPPAGGASGDGTTGGTQPAGEASSDGATGGTQPASEASSDGATGGTQKAGDGNGSVLHGSVVTDDDMVASERSRQDEQAVADRRYVPPAVRQALREQLADFAEFAHRERVGMSGPPALGSGGGITAAVVRELATLIRSRPDAASSDEPEDLADVLGALVAPAQAEFARIGRAPADLTAPGSLRLDVATASVGTQRPTIRFIRADRRVAAGDGDVTDAGPVDAEPATPCAAMIVGSAAAVAAGRPYLSIDALTAYARREAFLESRDDTKPETARTGMRAARSLEIVVLLDLESDTGVWVDVDPGTGKSAAAFAINVGGPVQRRTVRFTGLAAMEPGPPVRPSAAKATLSG